MSTMSENRREGVPWMERERGGSGGGGGTAVTATVIEGAEVVRTAAVSYATPILHQVFIQGGPTPPGDGSPSPLKVCQQQTPSASPTASDYGRCKSSTYATTSSTSGSVPLRNGFTASSTSDTEDSPSPLNKGSLPISHIIVSNSLSSQNSLAASSSSSSSPSPPPLWVLSPGGFLPSNSMVLRPVSKSSPPRGGSEHHGPLPLPPTISFTSSSCTSVLASSSPPSLSSSSSSSSPTLLYPFHSPTVTKTDDELTSLSWLQDSNLLMGTALSPIKQNAAGKAGEAKTGLSNGAENNKTNSKSSPARKDSSSKLEESKDQQQQQQQFVSKKNGGNGSASNSGGGVVSNGLRCEGEEEYKIESPTSDYGEGASEPSGESPADGNGPVASGKGGSSSFRSAQAVPYNPKVHVKAKPPFSFSCLIFMAIEQSPSKALPVKDIYSWILEHYPYYRNAPTGWKNSVRHNLSLNKCFSKVEKTSNLGKGSLWMVDPAFRPNLLQAMSKTPFTTQSKSDKTYLMTNKAVVINTKYLYGNSVGQENGAKENASMAKISLSCKSSSSNNPANANGINGNNNYLIAVNNKNNSDRSNHRICVSRDGSSTEALKGQTEAAEIREDKNPEKKKKTQTAITKTQSPNPELFPRLAKRLESHANERSDWDCEEEGEGEGEGEGEVEGERELGVAYEEASIHFQSEDVDAAAAMLVLKHGPRMLSPYRNNFVSIRENADSLMENVDAEMMSRNHYNSESSDSGSMLISSSPSLDHAYITRSNRKGTHHSRSNNNHTSYINNKNNGRGRLLRSKVEEDNSSPSSSVDEAFFDDPFESEVVCEQNSICVHESRPFEEADALLNLAAVATSLASRELMVLDDKGEEPRSPPGEGEAPLEAHFSTYEETQAQTRTDSAVANMESRCSATESSRLVRSISNSSAKFKADCRGSSRGSSSSSSNSSSSSSSSSCCSSSNSSSDGEDTSDGTISARSSTCKRKRSSESSDSLFVRKTHKKLNKSNRSFCNNNNNGIINKNKLFNLNKGLKEFRN